MRTHVAQVHAPKWVHTQRWRRWLHACPNGLLAPTGMHKRASGACTPVQTGHWHPYDAGGGARAPVHVQTGQLAAMQQCYRKWGELTSYSCGPVANPPQPSTGPPTPGWGPLPYTIIFNTIIYIYDSSHTPKLFLWGLEAEASRAEHRPAGGCLSSVSSSRSVCLDGTVTCDSVACPVKCGWSAWSPWTPCSRSCGVGMQQRFR